MLGEGGGGGRGGDRSSGLEAKAGALDPISVEGNERERERGRERERLKNIIYLTTIRSIKQ